ncbi:unnamed protein product [Arabis nemorensis]|uniref:Uncharacterized protein n=1 Tax=Arabis nemorensis TaxID=586526 RepID=A0A565C1T0_9BRAS|nr:unnamed protein product [Arabis nemorensis]
MKISLCLVKANPRALFLANKDGKSPMYLAVEARVVSLVKAILNDNAQGQTSNLASRLEGRKSLVQGALKAKNREIVDIILTEDPSLINERDEEG